MPFLIPEGKVIWNCEARDELDNIYSASKNGRFFKQDPFAIDYIHPTPLDRAVVSNKKVTIKVKGNHAIKSAKLLWQKVKRNESNVFVLSMDEILWEKWGFLYPVAYIFEYTNANHEVIVKQRSLDSEEWIQIPVKNQDDFFNGEEVVRFDHENKLLYVSVGFKNCNQVSLMFESPDEVYYAGIAKYYDNRKAAYTLSLDNWGKLATANPGIPCVSMTDDNGDKYQAALWAVRYFNIPTSIAINSAMEGDEAMWDLIQQELDVGGNIFEPAVHTKTHPCSNAEFTVLGYYDEIIGCRDRDREFIPLGVCMQKFDNDHNHEAP